MKQCQTCGKEIEQNAAVFTLNGRYECKECATKNYHLKKAKMPLLPKKIDDSEIDSTEYESSNKSDSSAGLSFNFSSTLLKIIVVIKLIVNLIGSIVAGVAIDNALYYTTYNNSGVGFIGAVVLILLSLVLFAAEFLFLQMASDISVIRRITVKNYQNNSSKKL